MRNLPWLLPLTLLVVPACGDDAASGADPVDPDTAPQATIDRFSAEAGTLMVRDGDNLPAANAPIDFDDAPFITTGLGPDGAAVRYYNFDVQPTSPAPIYVLFRDGADAPVDGQLNIVDVIPGDAAYNDLWQPVRVTVPSDYVANTVTSFDEIRDQGLPTENLDTLVNCPVVPAGSTATARLDDADAGLVRGWHDGEVIHYFHFGEAALAPTSAGLVPTSPIYVAFNVNPGEEGGGPPSGFVTETGTEQTHNVIATTPDEPGYSPLWAVNIYDNADFDAVADLDSALDASILVEYATMVNCPVVWRAEP